MGGICLGVESRSNGCCFAQLPYLRLADAVEAAVEMILRQMWITAVPVRPTDQCPIAYWAKAQSGVALWVDSGFALTIFKNYL